MFGAREAKALGPGEHLTVAGAPGLRLVATATRRTWTYRYRSPTDGSVRQVRLGHWPAMGIAAALAAWERVRAQRDAGADPAQERKQGRAALARQAVTESFTVQAACAGFLRAYSGTVAPRTYAEAARLLRSLGGLAERPVGGITRAEAYAHIQACAHAPVVAAARKRVLAAVWDWALDSGQLLPECPNWWRLILRGKLPSRGKTVAGQQVGVSKRTLTDGELALLLPWLPNFSRDVADAVTLYLWTGCRGAEIVAAEVDEVTQEPTGWWWTVPRAKLKMRRNPLTTDLRVPLVGRALAVVQRRAAAHGRGWLFSSVGATGHIEQKAVGVAVWTHHANCESRPEWVRPRLPVAGWAPHDLRRTVRTGLAALGCPDVVAEAVLGHLPAGVSGAYNRHRYDDERREWLMRWAAHLERLCTAPAQV